MEFSLLESFLVYQCLVIEQSSKKAILWILMEVLTILYCFCPLYPDLYGYKDSMSGGGGFGGGGGGGGGGGYGGSLMKRGLSGGSGLSSSVSNADAVIAKINQRLDMLTQLEGGMKGGGRSDR